MTIGALLKTKGRNVISVQPVTPLLDIAQIIATQRIGAVLVLDEAGDVAGIVSERDVVKAFATHAAKLVALRAEDVMTRDVVTASLATPIDQAMEIMDTGYFRHLPVLEEGKLAGIISIRDVVKYRLMQHEHDVDNLKAYIARQV